MALARRQHALRVPQVDDARTGDAGAGCAVERLHEATERIGREHGVVVQQQQAIGARGERRAGAGVEPAGELPVVVEQQQPDARPRADAGAEPRPLRRPRRVVDDDHLVGRTILREERCDAAVGGCPALPGDDDGGDPPAHAARPSGRTPSFAASTPRQARGHLRRTEVLQDVCARGRAQARAERRILEQPRDGGGQRLGVVRRAHEAVRARLEHLAQRRTVARHQGASRGGRLVDLVRHHHAPPSGHRRRRPAPPPPRPARPAGPRAAPRRAT